MAAGDWDSLPIERRAAITAARQRVHGSVPGEAKLRVEDARFELAVSLVDWLRLRGHGAAANDIADNWLEQGT